MMSVSPTEWFELNFRCCRNDKMVGASYSKPLRVSVQNIL